MCYEAAFWHNKKGEDGKNIINPHTKKFVKERRSYKRDLFTEKNENYYYFWTGFVPRIKKAAEVKGIKVETNNLYSPESFLLKDPILNGKNFDFKEPQIRLIKNALRTKRGVIVSPTGTGKTSVIQMAILSAMPNEKKVVVSHTKDIVLQTAEKLTKAGFDVDIIGAGLGIPEMSNANIAVATMPSLAKYLDYENNRTETMSEFKMVIVDESHRVSKMNGTYAQILQWVNAPYRFGFTASPKSFDEDPEAYLTVEGLLGPVIDEMTFEEGVEEGLIVRPKISLIRVPYSSSIRDIRNYQEVYQKGIIENNARNGLIVEKAMELERKNKSVLIFVNQIRHGEIIKGKLDQTMRNSVPFVMGNSNNEVRIKVRNFLEDKKEKIVICTTVWKEGIDIPTLDNVIYAGGLKSDTATLQSIGRGTRKPKGKEIVTIYDFFDPSHPFLVNHFGYRITLYMEKGWMT